jgi:hypothetical protein
MTAQTHAAEVIPIDRTVTGAPKKWLRLEAALLLAGSLRPHPSRPTQPTTSTTADSGQYGGRIYSASEPR